MQSFDTGDKLESTIPQGVIIRDDSDNFFTGVLSAPKIRNTSLAASLEHVVSVASFGKPGQSIHFKNASNQDMAITIRMPAPSRNFGDAVKIYYSENSGVTWNFHTDTTVIPIHSRPYVEFTTTHFTDFAVVGGGSGSFVINDDAPATTSLDVILNMSLPQSASGMRFQNEGTG